LAAVWGEGMSPESADWTIGKLIEWTRGFFEKKDIPQPRLEAEILLAHVLGIERIDLYMRYEQPSPRPSARRSATLCAAAPSASPRAT
jgi:hypothetical protein